MNTVIEPSAWGVSRDGVRQIQELQPNSDLLEPLLARTKRDGVGGQLQVLLGLLGLTPTISGRTEAVVHRCGTGN